MHPSAVPQFGLRAARSLDLTATLLQIAIAAASPAVPLGKDRFKG